MKPEYHPLVYQALYDRIRLEDTMPPNTFIPVLDTIKSNEGTDNIIMTLQHYSLEEKSQALGCRMRDVWAICDQDIGWHSFVHFIFEKESSILLVKQDYANPAIHLWVNGIKVILDELDGMLAVYIRACDKDVLFGAYVFHTKIKQLREAYV